MREFKFRAWDKERKEILPVKMLDFSQWWVSCDPHYGTSKPGEYGERNSFKNEETDRHILMQYTGLKDGNGREIYEGDIVKHLSGWIGKVHYIEGTFEIEAKHKCWPLNYARGGRVDVIGNIYQNSKLLEDTHV